MEQEFKRKQSFLLRLPVSIREQATTTARNEGISLNHFISLAVAEKISRVQVLRKPTEAEITLPQGASMATPMQRFAS